MVRRTQATHDVATDMAVPTSAHGWGLTQAARIVQVLKACQGAGRGGWGLFGRAQFYKARQVPNFERHGASELTGLEIPAVADLIQLEQTCIITDSGSDSE